MNTRLKSLLAGAVAMLAVFGAGSAQAATERYYSVDLSIDACFANGTPDSVLQTFATAYVVKASDLSGWDGTVGALASVPKLFTQTLSKGANLQMSVSWSENNSGAWSSVRYGGEADYKAVVASESACFVVDCTYFYNDYWADYYGSGATWYYEGVLKFSNASSPYDPAGLPIDVTLPVGTTGYGFVVSNLTDGVGIQPTVAGGTTYALPAGVRVGIYAVPEPGYVVMGEPFFIKEVTAGMTINPSLLPKAIEAVVVESFAVSDGVARVGVKNPVTGFYYALKASDTPGGDYVLVMESITNAAAAGAAFELMAPASAATRFYKVLVSLDDPKQAALGGVQLHQK